MTQSILPICKNPPVKGYQFYAYQLSVICTKDNYLSGLSNHFIQLYCNPKDVLLSFYEPFFWYTSNPWFNYEWISQKTIRTMSLKLSDVIINYIDNKQYVLAIVDDFFIPERRAYKSFHNRHDILIFGYDTKNKQYDAMSYNNKGEYTHIKVSFQDLEKAFYALDINDNCIIPYKLKSDIDYNFNPNRTKSLLIDFLYSNNTSEKLKELIVSQYLPDHVFGINTYSHLINDLKLIKEGKIKNDIRSLHFLLEHKNRMLSLINFMGENGYLKSSDILLKDYKSIANKALVAKNLQIKYGLTDNSDDINEIINLLTLITQEEANVIENILDSLTY